MCELFSGSLCGRLEVVLDRSWETQSVTWSQLTWWDPLPCGAELVSLVTSPSPLPLPSPSHSLLGHPPSPARSLPPTHLNFRSRSSTPSPVPGSGYNRRHSRSDSLDSLSPLAMPLPHSPESYNSVFHPSSYSSSPDLLPSTLSFSPNLSYLSSSLPMALPHPKQVLSGFQSYYPTLTPPDSERRPTCLSSQNKSKPRRMFNFPLVPPPAHIPPPLGLPPPPPTSYAQPAYLERHHYSPFLMNGVPAAY